MTSLPQMRPTTTKPVFNLQGGAKTKLGYSGFKYYEAKKIFDQSMVLAAYQECGGNKTAAAFMLGVGKQWFYKIFNTIPKTLISLD